jgi:hypothetical protein
MNRLLRRCLLLLLCLTLPVSGLAVVQLPAEPCPMQADAMQMDDDQPHDCCEEKDQLPTAGKTCKTGQECKSGNMLQASLGKPALSLPHLPAPTLYRDFLPSGAPADVWRPPRA